MIWYIQERLFENLTAVNCVPKKIGIRWVFTLPIGTYYSI